MKELLDLLLMIAEEFQKGFLDGMVLVVVVLLYMALSYAITAALLFAVAWITGAFVATLVLAFKVWALLVIARILLRSFK